MLNAICDELLHKSPLNNFEKSTCFELKLKLKFVNIYEKVEFTVFLNLAKFISFLARLSQ